MAHSVRPQAKQASRGMSSSYVIAAGIQRPFETGQADPRPPEYVGLAMTASGWAVMIGPSAGNGDSGRFVSGRDGGSLRSPRGDPPLKTALRRSSSPNPRAQPAGAAQRTPKALGYASTASRACLTSAAGYS